jgi:hypothetical protein
MKRSFWVVVSVTVLLIGVLAVVDPAGVKSVVRRILFLDDPTQWIGIGLAGLVVSVLAGVIYYLGSKQPAPPTCPRCGQTLPEGEEYLDPSWVDPKQNKSAGSSSTQP